MLIPSLAFLLGLAALVWSADLFVNGASSLAKHLGMSPTMIGLTIVAFGTSAPEILVSGSAALEGAAELGIGNAIGSNIANIGLVLGVTALVAIIPVSKAMIRLEIPVLIFATAVAGICLFDAHLSRIEGISLLTAAFLVTAVIIRQVKKQKDLIPVEQEIPSTNAKKASLYFIIGLIVLLFSADLLVWSATSLAEQLGVSSLVIGLTVVAIGTSLPELAASIASALKGHHDIAIGNIVGSNVLNILAVMSLPGIIAPGDIDSQIFIRDYLFMLGLTICLLLIIVWFIFIHPKHFDHKNQLDDTPQKGSAPSNPYYGIGRLSGLLFLSIYISYYYFLFTSA